MNRRLALSDLATAVVGVISTSTNSYAGIKKGTKHLPDIFRRNAIQLPDFINNTRSTVDIGRRYLSLYDVNEHIISWQEKLLNAAGGKEQQVLYSLINHKIHEDYSLGRTTIFEGWILSNSELHICAAVTLIKETSS